MLGFNWFANRQSPQPQKILEKGKVAEVNALTAQRQKLVSLLSSVSQRKSSLAKLSSSIPNHREKLNMLLWHEFVVCKNERGLLFKNGDFQKFLLPGTYHYFGSSRKIAVEVYDLSVPEFEHRLTDFLVKTYPAEIARYFTLVELGPQQVALIYQNGRLTNILSPSTRTLYWKGIIEITVEVINISTDFVLPLDKAETLLHTPSKILQSQVKAAIYHQEITEHRLGLLYVEGQCLAVLKPGLHAYWQFNRKISIEVYDLSVPEFKHRVTDFLIKDYPAEIADYFIQVELGPQQVALIYKNGRLADILPPATRTIYWKGIVEITTEIIDISTHFILSQDKATTLIHTQLKTLQPQVAAAIYFQEITEHHLGLLYVEGQFLEILKPGLHAYWQFNRNIVIETIDTRLQNMEVSGQEILTKDKVGLRINLSANYLIKDVLQMKSTLTQPIDYLYRELQFGLRAAVGTRTLDELLENKNIIDELVFAHIQKKITGFGIEVQSVGVKDIILPGEMKTILSKVVEAEKIAQANLIRRREETAATRSLLNTAKVMEDNPTALRLKELEMLEKVTEKVGSISVYGGLEGLLKELIKIKP